MIGGRFKIASVASIAAAGLFMGGVAAQAADLGGNCCADLEERVAELEATTARKGNRKVSLQVSGHINEAVMFWDDGLDSGVRVVGNNFSQSRFRFLGSAKINADWSAGFLMEFGVPVTGASSSANQFANPAGALAVRHTALYVKSNSLGTLWMGHTTDAVDGIVDICLGCTTTSSPESGLGWGGMYITNGIGGGQRGSQTFSGLRIGNEGHFGTRRNVIKYISPTMGGFQVSGSWGDDDATAGGVNNTHGYIWDVALRYAGEFGAIRFAAGIGYTENTQGTGGTGAAVNSANDTSYAGSASIQHVPTGLYVQGAFARKDLWVRPAAAGALTATDDFMWSAQVGVAQKWSSLGDTTVWVQYQEYDNGIATGTAANAGLGLLAVAGAVSTDAEIISFGINQKIDAAALELYVTYWNVQSDVNFGAGSVANEDLNVIMAGALLKF